MLKKVVTDLLTNTKQTIYPRTVQVHHVPNRKRTPKTNFSFDSNEKKELDVLPETENTYFIESFSWTLRWGKHLEHESLITEPLHCMLDALSKWSKAWITSFAFSQMNVYCNLPLIMKCQKSVYKPLRDFYTVNVKRPPDFSFIPCI